MHLVHDARSLGREGAWLHAVPWLALLLTVLLALAVALCSGPSGLPAPDPYPFPLAGWSAPAHVDQPGGTASDTSDGTFRALPGALP